MMRSQRKTSTAGATECATVMRWLRLRHRGVSSFQPSGVGNAKWQLAGTPAATAAPRYEPVLARRIDVVTPVPRSTGGQPPNLSCEGDGDGRRHVGMEGVRVATSRSTAALDAVRIMDGHEQAVGHHQRTSWATWTTPN
jgi:hypothetical protein